MPFKYEKYIDAQNGTGIVLTIDEVIQHYMEKYLENAVIEDKVAQRGVGIVMNVNTGEVLALAVKGGYDLNNPRTVDDANVAKLIEAETDPVKKAEMLKTAQLAPMEG